MITSTITILSEGNNRLTYETKKLRNDEDLARRLRTDRPTDQRTDGRTDKPAYRDMRTHLKTMIVLHSCITCSTDAPQGIRSDLKVRGGGTGLNEHCADLISPRLFPR